MKWLPCYLRKSQPNYEKTGPARPRFIAGPRPQYRSMEEVEVAAALLRES